MNVTPPRTIYAFGTSGYRSNTATGFDEAVIRQITYAISDYLIREMQAQGQAKPVLIGGDTREKSRRFIPVIARLLLERGLDVYQATSDLPTPVLAYAAREFHQLGLPHREAAGAILMTASHNPWDYGGYNFLTHEAAVVPTQISKAFEALQAAPLHLTLDRAALGISEPPTLRSFDPYAIYQTHLQQGLHLDLEAIRASGLTVCYDPLYATGRIYLPRLLREASVPVISLHDTDERPADYTGMPEPSADNLQELAQRVRDTAGLKIGLANDGDADRFGVLDETGRYLLPNDVLLLTLYHLLHHRKVGGHGVVVRSQATSHRLDAMAEEAGLGVVQTPVGYKYIAEAFIHRQAEGLSPVLLGGESSGGLSIDGHIPEKDGLLANLLMAELVALEGKPLSEILTAVQARLPVHYGFAELAIHTPRGEEIRQYFQNRLQDGDALFGAALDGETSRQAAEALEVEFGTRDGIKLYCQNGNWLLTRISGTEPLARIYFEVLGPSAEAAQAQRDTWLAAIMALLEAEFDVPPAAVVVKA